MADLSLPTEISPDGREIWDWAHRLSAEAHRAQRIREVQEKLRRVGRRCGDCDNWMKSSQCPREVNVRGMNRGPSCEAPICGKFVETSYAVKQREQLASELQSLTATPAKGESHD